MKVVVVGCTHAGTAAIVNIKQCYPEAEVTVHKNRNKLMIEKRLDNSPIYYYKTDNNKKQTIMFVHSAFADHTQYNEQIAFF